MSKQPLEDEFDRETFYRGADPDADDDEYELEPPDEEIIAGEKRRADEAVESASHAVDVDELYRQHDAIGMDDLEEYLKDARFQFTTKQLLIATTVLAVLLVLGRLLVGGWFPVLVVLVFTVLASTYSWFAWQEHQKRQEWEEKREELYERNKKRHGPKEVDPNDQPL